MTLLFFVLPNFFFLNFVLGFVAVDWEVGELSEDEEGQLEVVWALPPKERDTTELLSETSLKESGLWDPIPQGNMVMFFIFFMVCYLLKCNHYNYGSG